MEHQCLIETKVANFLVAVDRIYSKSADFTCIPGSRSAGVDRQVQMPQRGFHLGQWHKIARDGSSLVQLDTKSILIFFESCGRKLKNSESNKNLKHHVHV